MARDDEEADRIKRRREREDEQESGGGPGAKPGSPQGEKFEELLRRAEPMIERLGNLYNQYIAGVEKFPPIEQRKQLEQTMQTLMLMPKPTAGAQFKFSTIQATFVTHRERWDRMLKDLEAGKLRRGTGK